MSTRTNIVVRDKYSSLWFYRHSDGYPEGAMPVLQTFISWLRRDLIRNNVSQSAGWLIILGAIECNAIPTTGQERKSDYKLPKSLEAPKDFKCGSIEPTHHVHGDIEYLYVIDLNAKTISCYENWDDDGCPVGEPLFVDTEENPWVLTEPQD